jgi:hypothetical protein
MELLKTAKGHLIPSNIIKSELCCLMPVSNSKLDE